MIIPFFAVCLAALAFSRMATSGAWPRTIGLAVLAVIAGGFLIAFSEVIVTYAWKKVAGYVLPEALQPDGLAQLLSTDYKFAVSFGILVLVLIFKPTGLFKGQSV